MRNAPKSILSYVFGFVIWFGAVFALAHFLVGMTESGGGEAPGWTTLMIGGSMLLAITLVPLFFLKQFAKMSRHVEHDDSKFDASKIADHQDRNRIQYY